jgi:hypothetical protein
MEHCRNYKSKQFLESQFVWPTMPYQAMSRSYGRGDINQDTSTGHRKIPWPSKDAS